MTKEAAPAPRRYVVHDWQVPLGEQLPIAEPIMPEGSVELVGGDWVLPSGERVTPVYPGQDDDAEPPPPR